MIVSLSELLPRARAKGYAIGAFNTTNLEITKAIIEAAVEAKSSVIIQTSEKAIDYAGLNPLRALVLEMAASVKVPVVLHLDHGRTFQVAKQCLEAGYSSVMVDASRMPFRDNVYTMRKTVAYARKFKASVEGELGPIAGQEDYVHSAKAYKTDPEHARMFADQSEVDALAVSVGLAHGLKLKEEKLDLKLLKQISEVVEIPLVLHGASKGATEKEIKQAIGYGVAKINIDTALRVAWSSALRAFFAAKENKDAYDPRTILTVGTQAVKQQVLRHMKLFGSVGKK
ncbi:MAG TPA: tagatose-bisphosphate aldolase [Candidatus Magasanikbacteria bacterium]|nr:tagatose-bisphosphate aldolase [Candidatus Magasanikbacteria bacterium]